MRLLVPVLDPLFRTSLFRFSPLPPIPLPRVTKNILTIVATKQYNPLTIRHVDHGGVVSRSRSCRT